jgi:hypothetical protein
MPGRRRPWHSWLGFHHGVVDCRGVLEVTCPPEGVTLGKHLFDVVGDGWYGHRGEDEREKESGESAGHGHLGVHDGSGFDEAITIPQAA